MRGARRQRELSENEFFRHAPTLASLRACIDDGRHTPAKKLLAPRSGRNGNFFARCVKIANARKRRARCPIRDRLDVELNPAGRFIFVSSILRKIRMSTIIAGRTEQRGSLGRWESAAPSLVW